MPQVTIDYLAGFMDGEGSISAGYVKRKRNQNYNFEFNSYVNITNTNRMILEKMQDFLGYGSISSTDQNVKWKVSHKLYFVAEEQELLLPVLRDRLIMKQRQADLVMEYLKIRGSPGDPEVPLDIFKRRVGLCLELQRLNRRGKDSE